MVTTPNDCQVSSNTLELTQYTTPYLNISPSPVLCPDSSITLIVVTTANSNLVWESPLSGSDLTQTIDQPGIYTCTVDACNISTTLSITILGSVVEALISTADETVLCKGDTFLLSANAGYNYLWKPNNEISTSISVFEEGTYQLYCTNDDGCVAIDSIFISETVIVAEPPIANNGPVCANETLIFTTDFFGGVAYYWTGPNGFTSTSPNPFFENVTVLQEGIYTLTMQEGLCKSDTVDTEAFVDEAFGLSDISSNFPICIGSELELYTNYVENVIYSWSGPNDFISALQNPTTYFDAQDTGYYFLEASRGACKANEEIFIFGDDCDINTVNVFTPNGDGINDFFSFSKENLLTIDVEIYNRWGQLIYSWDNVNGRWDGTILKTGKKASEGVYYYVARMLPRNGYLQNFKGYLNLLY